MKNSRSSNEKLASIGTILVLASLLLTIAVLIVSPIRLGDADRFIWDFLNFQSWTVKLLPLTLIGGGLLAWLAKQARPSRKLIRLFLLLAAGLLIVGNVLTFLVLLYQLTWSRAAPGLPLAVALAAITALLLAPAAFSVAGLFIRRDLSSTADPVEAEAQRPRPFLPSASVSLGLGAVGFVTIWFPFPPLGIILGILAIYTGVLARRRLKAAQEVDEEFKRDAGKAMAGIGIALGLVDLLVPVVVILAFIQSCGSNGFCM